MRKAQLVILYIHYTVNSELKLSELLPDPESPQSPQDIV